MVINVSISLSPSHNHTYARPDKVKDKKTSVDSLHQVRRHDVHMMCSLCIGFDGRSYCQCEKDYLTCVVAVIFVNQEMDRGRKE